MKERRKSRVSLPRTAQNRGTGPLGGSFGFAKTKYGRFVAGVLAAGMVFQAVAPGITGYAYDNRGGAGFSLLQKSTPSDSGRPDQRPENGSGSGANGGGTGGVHYSEATASDALGTKAEEENILANGSFETTKPTSNPFWTGGLMPTGWEKTWDASKNSQGVISLTITDEESVEGDNSVHISSNNTKARMEFFGFVPIDYNKNYICSYKYKTKDVKGTGFYFRVSPLKDGTLETLIQKPFITGTEEEWQEAVIFLENDPEKKANELQMDFFTEYMTGDVWIDDVQIIPTYRMTLDQKDARMDIGQALTLTPQYSGGETADAIEWTTSDSAVATVDEFGVVTAVAGGTAVITAEIDEYHKSSSTVTVSDVSLKEYYKNIRQDWRDRITGNGIENPDDADYRKLMTNLEEEATGYWESMKTAEGDTTLWADLNLKVEYKASSNSADSADFATAFTRVETMARAYSSEGCSLYGQEALKTDLIDALTWLHKNVYNEKYDVQKKLYGNWWHWEIGIPQSLCNIVIMMYEDLPAELVVLEAKTLERFNEDPTYAYKVQGWGKMEMTSANLMDTSLVSALRSAIGEDSAAISKAKAAFSSVLPYVTKGDGFYEDGSCVQHTNLAYTGGYGSTLLSGIEKILFITSGTPWEITDENVDNVFSWVWDGYRPLFADGAIMDMVSGRGIARPSRSDQSAGKGILKAVTNLSQLAPEELEEEIQGFVKTSIEEGIKYNPGYFEDVSVTDMVAMKKLLAEAGDGDKNEGYKLFGAMDKAVYHRPAFSLGISMYSSRMASFEYGNGENVKGWHMSDGATYLYNGDQAQYADNYWPTVDPMRLAGITTDHTAGTISGSWAAHTSSCKWVGGSSVSGRYGSTGMNFEGENTSLSGKKSWFTFGDQIVALGAGVSSDESKAAETIVENRKLREDGSNRLLADGSETDLTEGESRSISMNWALLEGNDGEEQNIGYYFPESSQVEVLKEERTGSWRDINTSIKADAEAARPVTRTYLSLAISHGTAPEDADYSYILLPGKTQEEMEEYGENPSVEIISNTKNVQAVRDKELGVSGYNFWEPSSVNGVTAKGPLSLTMEEEGSQITLGISNPKQDKNNVTVILDGIYSVEEGNGAVTVSNDGSGTIITLKGSADFGKSYEIKMSKADPAEFSEMESRLYRQVMGVLPDESYDLSNPDVAAMIEKVNGDANKYWGVMNKRADAGRDEIFIGVKPVLAGGPNKNTENLTQTYKNLFKLVQAYKSNGTDLYQNREVVEEVLSAIDFTIDQKWYGKDVPTNSSSVWYYGNWWDHRIGVPAQLLPMMILLKDEPEFTEERFDKYMEAMIYQKANDWTGYNSANLGDIGQNTMYIAVLQKNPQLLSKMKERFGSEMFAYTTGKNGWYPDGSYVDHDIYAYTGGYGSVLVGAMSRILPILSGTSYEMEFGDERDEFYSNIILNGYLPLHYNGSLTDSVRGRSVTRQTAQRSTSAGHLALISEALGAEEEQYVKAVIKGWLENDPGILSALTRPSEIMACQNILKDSSIQAEKPRKGIFNYNFMDKVVQQSEDYMAVVSMHSNKIANYEYGNGEGGKLWNISDGALFLYQKDKDAYRNNYWATIDQLRLPGTTTLHDETRAKNAGSATTNPNSWVSGIGKGGTGLAGMQLKTMGQGKNRDGLLVKKSYFLFDGVIVSLGSDISNLNPANTANGETIIENRKIETDLSNELTVNGMPAPSGTTTDAVWAHLNGNSGEETGYVFFEPVKLESKKEVRTGYWKDINELVNMREDDNPVQAGYATLYLDHGANPQKASYSYAVLPGKTGEETKQFSENPTVEILANTAEVHGVYDRTSRTTAANFWTSKENKAGKITASRFATVLLQENEDSFTVTVADPTHGYENPITFGIDLPSDEMITADAGISVKSIGERTEFILSAPGSKENESFTITFKKGLTESEKIDKMLEDFEEQLDKADLNVKGEIEALKMVLETLNTERFDEAQKQRLEAIKAQVKAVLGSMEAVEDLLEDADSFQEVTADNADQLEELLSKFDQMDEEQKKLLPESEKKTLEALKEKMSVDVLENTGDGIQMEFLDGKVDIRTKVFAEDKKELVESYQQVLPQTRYLNMVFELSLVLKGKPLSLLEHPARVTIPLPVELQGENIAVLYFPAETKQARMAVKTMVIELEDTQVNGSQISFTVSGDGYYGFAIVKEEGKPEIPEIPEEPEVPKVPGKASDSSDSEDIGYQAAGNWQQDMKGWKFRTVGGAYLEYRWGLIGNRWYHFDAAGYMETGWLKLGTVWYYLNPSGDMAEENWVLDQGKWYYLHKGGAMAGNQWVNWKEKWYYLDQTGAMLTGGRTPDGFYVGTDGVWAK